MRTTASDLYDLVFVADPRISPRGGSVVATVTTIIAEDGDDPPRYRTRIHEFSFDDAGSRVLTRGPGSDTHPRFDTTGSSLAFLRTQEAGSGDEAVAQLFVMPLDGGEARQVTARKAGVARFTWHPDGDRIALVSPRRRSRPYADGAPLRVTRARHKLDGKRLETDVPYEILLLSVRKILVADASGRDGSVAPDLLVELPFEPSQISFSRDGTTLFALAATNEHEDAELRSNVLAIDLDRPEPRPLLPSAMQIEAFSLDPDTGELWFLAPVDITASSTPKGLWHLSVAGTEPRLTSGDRDVSPSTSGDSRYGEMPTRPVCQGGGWIVAVNAHGRSNLALLEPGEEAVSYLTEGDQAVTAFDASAEAIVFIAEEPHRPGELFVRFADGREARLSTYNESLCTRQSFVEASSPVTINADGTELTYWRLEPTEPRRDGAIVVQVHGGPAANYGYGFTFEFQLLAAAGYTVVYGNPRGGSSFGRAFAGAIQGRYGTVDAADVMAMVEHAAAGHRVAGAPIHLTGGSYGGFMTNWLIGHTDRFRSAVTQRSISNFTSFYGTSDIGPWFAEREIGGTPWERLQGMWDQSPLKHVAAIRTPLLILHSEEDHRCPIEQAEQLYTALKRIGRVPTELVRFPGEGHELSRSGRPDRRVARLEALLEWFSRHA